MTKLRKYMTKNTKIKPALQSLDNDIDGFMDTVVKKIDGLSKKNPVFKRRMYQSIADVNKEKDEFVMAVKRVVNALDAGAKVLPAERGSAERFNGVKSIVTTDEEPKEEPKPEPKKEEPKVEEHKPEEEEKKPEEKKK